MGTLYYADATRVAIPIEDRALAHIKFVMIAKLRRNEAFTFSWDKPEEEGGGRSSIWVSAQIPLEFEFDDPTPVELNREWIEQLSQSASTVSGLVPIPEPVKA
jgi:hypothetical protein